MWSNTTISQRAKEVISLVGSKFGSRVKPANGPPEKGALSAHCFFGVSDFSE